MLLCSLSTVDTSGTPLRGRKMTAQDTNIKVVTLFTSNIKQQTTWLLKLLITNTGRQTCAPVKVSYHSLRDSVPPSCVTGSGYIYSTLITPLGSP